MTLRLPEELDRRLDELAAQRHTSKHSLVLQAVEELVRAQDAQEKIDRAVDYTFERYGDVVDRLADA